MVSTFTLPMLCIYEINIDQCHYLFLHTLIYRKPLGQNIFKYVSRQCLNTACDNFVNLFQLADHLQERPLLFMSLFQPIHHQYQMALLIPLTILALR